MVAHQCCRRNYYYFIQQLDDYPFLTSFSNRSLGADSTHLYPTVTLNESLPTFDNKSSAAE
jgi:hypothetical protein